MLNSSVSIVRQALKGTDQLKTDLYNLFRLLAVCHTVVVDHDPRTGAIIY